MQNNYCYFYFIYKVRQCIQHHRTGKYWIIILPCHSPTAFVLSTTPLCFNSWLYEKAVQCFLWASYLILLPWRIFWMLPHQVTKIDHTIIFAFTWLSPFLAMATRGADVMAGGLRVGDSFQFEAGSWPEESYLEWEERAEKFPGWCVVRFLSPSPGVSGVTFWSFFLLPLLLPSLPW